MDGLDNVAQGGCQNNCQPADWPPPMPAAQFGACCRTKLMWDYQILWCIAVTVLNTYPSTVPMFNLHTCLSAILYELAVARFAAAAEQAAVSDSHKGIVIGMVNSVANPAEPAPQLPVGSLGAL